MPHFSASRLTGKITERGITPREKTCHSQIPAKDQDYKGWGNAPAPFEEQSAQSCA